MQITPYLEFNGQCREAFTMYAELLGGRLVGITTFGESPMAEKMPESTHGMVMHAELELPSGSIMGSDQPGEGYAPPAGVHLAIGVDTVEEAERIFAGLAEGGSVTMPLDRTFWAERFGMLTDRFGVKWMVNCDAPRA